MDNFPIIRPVSRAGIHEIPFFDFVLNEFFQTSAYFMSQNSKIDDWMSFPKSVMSRKFADMG